MKAVYKVVLVTALAMAAVLYGLFLNTLSETAMVRLSYFWFPGMVYGTVGLLSGESSPRRPLIAAVISLIALLVFFEGIFPSL
ncbi:MAG TPA: hypothetical protein VM940_13445 [Chthoniobacterales bacterium]|jgi:lysylphosphatidylglycerol synthetase-like protein (DUF2156 family)|nr:hypothetical protein [Chthoniobacterales bacterium]